MQNSNPETNKEVHAAAAEQHGAEARAKAAEAGAAAGESASEATQAAKERLAQAGDVTKSAAERTAAAASETGAAAAERAGAAAEATKEAGAAVTERAGATTAAAKENLTEAGGVTAAIGFIKEHLPPLPKVEHSEDTPEERRAKALLDEAMGRPAEGAAAAAGGGSGENVVVAPEKDVPPPGDVEVKVLKDTRSKARQFLDSMGRTADSQLGAPFELRTAAAEEEHAKEALRSGRGLTEALEEKVETAKTAIREHMHLPGAEGSSSPPDRTAGEVAADAHRRAEEATRTAEDKASGAAHTVKETLSKAYHKVADPISDVVHSAENKARWAYEHTKDELLHKSSAETHAEMAPHTPYDAKLAHGEVPSSTQEILGGAPAPGTPVKAATAGGTAGDTAAEQALSKSAEGYGTENLGPTDARDLARDVVAAPAPGTFTEAPPGPVSADASAAGGSWAQRHGLTRTALRETFKEGIHDIDTREPGSEGEIPS